LLGVVPASDHSEMLEVESFREREAGSSLIPSGGVFGVAVGRFLRQVFFARPASDGSRPRCERPSTFALLVGSMSPWSPVVPLECTGCHSYECWELMDRCAGRIASKRLGRRPPSFTGDASRFRRHLACVLSFMHSLSCVPCFDY